MIWTKLMMRKKIGFIMCVCVLRSRLLSNAECTQVKNIDEKHVETQQWIKQHENQTEISIEYYPFSKTDCSLTTTDCFMNVETLNPIWITHSLHFHSSFFSLLALPGFHSFFFFSSSNRCCCMFVDTAAILLVCCVLIRPYIGWVSLELILLSLIASLLPLIHILFMWFVHSNTHTHTHRNVAALVVAYSLLAIHYTQFILKLR